MKSFLILALSTIFTFGLAQKFDYSYQQSYNVDGQANLKIEASDADIAVKSHNKDEIIVYYSISINGEVQKGTKEKINGMIDGNINHVVNHSGNDLYIKFIEKDTNNVHVSFVLYTPKNTNIDLYTEDGDIEVHGIANNVKLETEDGDIAISNIDGEKVEVESEDGDLAFSNVKADDVKAYSGDGDLSLKNIEGKHIFAKSGDGDIVVAHSKGNLKVRTGDGDVFINKVDGKVDARSGDGDVTRVN